MRLSLLLLLFSPIFTYASGNAGLVDGLWFSDNSPEAGEMVVLYAAVRNETDSEITGKVIFSIDSKELEPVTFSIPKGGLIRVSQNHTFSRGKYSVSAKVENSPEGMEAVSLGARTINVSSPPPETAMEYTLETGRSIVDTIDPIAKKFAEKIENIRDNISGVEKKSAKINESGSKWQEFIEASTEIINAEETPAWKRAAALAIGAFALPLNYWMWAVSLLVLWILFRLMRS